MGYDFHYVSDSEQYFRLNIFGMVTYLDAMYGLGMVYESSSKTGPEWPEWERYPDDTDRQTQFDQARAFLNYGEEPSEPVPDDIMAEARVFCEATTEKLRFHPDGGNVMPSHKFSTNDGWIVTPDEIQAALAVYDACEDRKVDEFGNYWEKWIDYLRCAVDSGGIEVW